MLTWTPPRSEAEELLDRPDVDPQLLQRNLRDMAQANRRLGAERAVLRQVARWINSIPTDRTPTVLDVGTGNAGLLRRLHTWSRRHGRDLRLLGCDVSAPVLQVAQRETYDSPIHLMRCNALHLPLADGTVDVVMCVQALHHFSRNAAERLVQECARVAQLGVIISDLRRSYGAYWGARLLALGPVSPLSRHDGPLSVLRAYTPEEAAQIVRNAGIIGTVQRRVWGMDVVIVGTRGSSSNESRDNISSGDTSGS
jgi:ubiquinone/menaquinone biosynthesis C-methylase UbiE